MKWYYRLILSFVLSAVFSSSINYMYAQMYVVMVFLLSPFIYLALGVGERSWQWMNKKEPEKYKNQ